MTMIYQVISVDYSALPARPRLVCQVRRGTCCTMQCAVLMRGHRDVSPYHGWSTVSKRNSSGVVVCNATSQSISNPSSHLSNLYPPHPRIFVSVEQQYPTSSNIQKGKNPQKSPHHHITKSRVDDSSSNQRTKRL
ncbi:hypothetical protein EX30DRAFT_207154 [Ascodesmis nigricans]|uniref:Uncharacterized protein n=1 Tax=Ascodesmis nigricans TaxID=341454 RepID=A0A4S2MR93_9PEZI|nr:hypothetical protein EX30DRAFT_207154 [Ascodesmis nigricans]